MKEEKKREQKELRENNKGKTDVDTNDSDVGTDSDTDEWLR